MSCRKFIETAVLVAATLAMSFSGSGCDQTCRNGSCDDTVDGTDGLQGSDNATYAARCVRPGS